MLAAALSFAQLAGRAEAQTAADPGLVEQGRYLAAAGDCAGCHGVSLKGGDPVPTPIGAIYASNITPDRETGIGSWSFEQFSDALRKGRAPEGHLYPAMPYTSYTGLSDVEVQALYSYLMLGVQPVSNRPPGNELPFPFIRAAMAPWDLMFLRYGKPTGAVDVSGEQRLRGRVLVETLGHCSACHSPRGILMQERADKHLAGAMVGGWWAPNITADSSGIGGWSDNQLATFLRTGHSDLGVAAGDMSTVVMRSLSKLTPDDIAAVVAYLRAVPKVVSPQLARNDITDASHPIDVAAIEQPTELSDWRAQVDHGTLQGDVLYQSACASCHGADGKGSARLVYPSLHLINSASTGDASNLVQVIAHGVNRTVGEEHTFMPPLRTNLSDAQIASLANFVRSEFGGVTSKLSQSDVSMTLKGGPPANWLIRSAKPLAIAAVVIMALGLLLTVWIGLRVLANRRATR
jgi:mono/diheme cytochrome c family protein